MDANQLLLKAFDHLRAGRAQDAISAYQTFLVQFPDHPDALHNCGLLMVQSGSTARGLELLEKSVHIAPRNAAFVSNLGAVHRSLGTPERAISCYQSAIELDPTRPESHYNLGNALQDLNRMDQAIECYQTAIRLKPDYFTAWLNLGKLFKDQARLSEARECYQRVVTGDKGIASRHAHDNLLHLLTLLPESTPESILAEHRAWAARVFAGVPARTEAHVNSRVAGRAIRLGYVGACLHEHPIGAMLEPVIARHDRKRFEVYCYSDVARADETSHRLRQNSTVWRSIVGISDERVAEMIREDGIDIAIDLNSHLAGSRLGVFALKPAPVQISYLAYPCTTGLGAMDYVITDALLDPPGTADAHNVERLLRLPHTYWCDRDRPENLTPGPLPADQNGFVTFVSLNNFSKHTQPTLSLWGRILARLPQSRLQLLIRGGEDNNGCVRQMIDASGIDWARVKILDRVPREQYMALFGSADISLDPFPYNGHTTTLDSLWMGVPVITLAGNRAVARGGVSILSNVGLTELIAGTEDEYVDKAAQVASDLPQLRHYRATLRDRMEQSPLRRPDDFTGHLEELFARAWQEWCRQ